MAPSRPAYGGQALLEGVMIRGMHVVTMAVRNPRGEIVTKVDPIVSGWSRALRKIPLVRGVLVLGEMLVIGTRAMMFSASVATEGEEPEEEKEVPAYALWITLAISLTIGIGIFFLLPIVIAAFLTRFIESSFLVNLIEGLLGIAMFVGYLALINRMPEIRRVFAYHGAEHMTIHAYEHNLPLEPQHIRQFSPAHPRCGTAFLLVVLVVSVLLFALVGNPPFILRVLSRVVLLPVIAGIAYEIIRWSGKNESNPLVQILIAPNLWLQALTTRQPDDSQIEVAVAAVNLAIEEDAKYEMA
jgi:uncharacterized protein YqhQ